MPNLVPLQKPLIIHKKKQEKARYFLLKIIISFGLILLIGLSRLPDLNSFVTPDETLWLTRSGNFYYAISHKDFATTFQKSHPGVTTMWAGLIGYIEAYPDYRDNYNEQNRPIGLGTLAKLDFTLPLEILIAGRRAIIILHMLILGVSFLFASQLFGIKPALMGFLLIAFDPFHIALSRILHLDGLLADLMLLSTLAFLTYLDNHKIGALLISGIAAGLAWLTKSPGLFLIPLITLLMIFDQAMKNKQHDTVWHKSIIQLIKVITVWGLLGVLVVFIAWPAMWVNPISSLVKVFMDAIGYAQTGHESAVFFNGKIYAGGEIPDLSFYPITFLWRTTPIILLGLITTIVLFIMQWLALPQNKLVRIPNHKLTANHETSIVTQNINSKIWKLTSLIFFSLGFAALMTMGLKKFDRYIMPSIVILDLIAGISLTWLLEWIAQYFHKKWKLVLTGGILLIFAFSQAFLAWNAFPYFFNYYNPLLGGSQKAVKIMQIGWGEGLNQAANYINNKPNAEQLRVMAWYGNGPFSYFSKSKVSALNLDHQWSTADWDQYNKSDYVVVYIHQWQRNLPSEVLERLKDIKPEYSIWIDGLEYVRVYKVPSN